MDRSKLKLKHDKDQPYHDQYDSIIECLNKDCKSETTIKSNLTDISYLSAKGYLKYTQISEEKFEIELTPNGHVFIAEGGFKQQRELEWEQNEDIELNREQIKKSLNYSFISNIISIIVMFITLLALLFEIFCKK